MASAGLLALGVAGIDSTRADSLIPAAGAEKPWTLSGSLRGFYDDNYNTVPNTPAPGQPPRRSSFGFEVRPSIAVNVPTDEQTTLTTSYIFSMKYYDDRPKNKEDFYHDFELFGDHKFSERYSGDVSDSFVIAQEPDLVDRGNLSAVTRVNGNNIRNNASINGHAQFTPLFGVVLGYANTFYDYDQSGPGSLAAALNRFEHLVTLDTRWQILPDTTGILGAQLTLVNHTSSDSLNVPVPSVNPTNYVNPNVRDQTQYIFYAGAEHSFTRELSALAKIGAIYVDFYNDPSAGNTWQPYVDMSLNWTYMDGGVVTMGFHVGRNQTDLSGGAGIGQITTDQESETLYGTVLQQITPKLTASLTGQFQNSTFHGGTLNNETDQIYLMGVNLAYQFTHYISAEVGYNYDRVNSDVPFRGYDRNRVYMGVTASY